MFSGGLHNTKSYRATALLMGITSMFDDIALPGRQLSTFESIHFMKFEIGK